MRRRPRLSGDAGAAAALVLGLLVLAVISWRRWGNPAFDAGFDLTVADGIVHGSEPYSDLRYYYGPAGVYALAAAFKLFGTHLWVAWGLGWAVTLSILGSFYVLARTWLSPLPAALGTAILLAVALSGTFFDYVLPHTQTGTFGALFLLLQVLAVTRRRYVLSGLVAGLCCLTRPEFVVFAAAVAVGTALGAWREEDRRAGLRTLGATAAPALLVAVPVLAYFAARAGSHRFFFENLIPLDFVRLVGDRLQGDFAPFSATSAVALLGRGLVYGGLLGGLLLAVAGARRATGLRARITSAWPLPAAIAGLLLLDGASRALGLFPGTRHAIEQECARLLIGMSWLPVAALVALGWVARDLLRRREAPWTTWPVDLALVAGAFACALRAYNRFTFDSYAPYYAALPILVAVILHDRIGRRWPEVRSAAFTALALIAAGLALHAYVGLYRDDTYVVRAPRGAYVAPTQAGAALQRTIDFIVNRSAPGAPMVVLPDDPGLHFLTGRPPALYEATFLPGTLDSVEDERKAVARMELVRPPLVILGAQTSEQYGFRQIGKDYNRVLLDYVRRRYRVAARFGDVSRPTENNEPAEAFTIYVRAR